MKSLASRLWFIFYFEYWIRNNQEYFSHFTWLINFLLLSESFRSLLFKISEIIFEYEKLIYIFFYLFDFQFWFGDLNLVFWAGKTCFDFLPVTLSLQILKEDDFTFDRINWITSFCLMLDWKSIASKGFIFSHSISTMRSTSIDLDL